MPKNKLPDINKLKNEVLKLLNRDLPRLVGNRAVNHFKASFDNQGFTNRSLQPWRKTKAGKGNTFGEQSQGILRQSGNLKRSIRMRMARGGQVVITAGNQNVNYSQIHNEGGTLTVPITAKSRKYFWYMFYKTNDLMWKRMALTKKTSMKIKIPKRQFMGNSEMLNKEIDHLITTKIKNLKLI